MSGIRAIPAITRGSAVDMFEALLSAKHPAAGLSTKAKPRLREHGNIIDKSDDWYTPAYVFAALGERFDLDVAAPVEGPRYVPADAWLHERGLETCWHGFVWMNPPFGHQETKRGWLAKFIEHGDGVALMPDRTSAPWWQWAAPKMDALLFAAPKIKFERPDGSIGESPGSGSVLMARGDRAVAALERAQTHKLGIVLRKLAENRADAPSNPNEARP